MSVGNDPVDAVARNERIVPVTRQELKRARLCVASRVPQSDVLAMLEMLGISDPPAVRLDERTDAA